MKMKGRQRQLDARERAFQHHLAQARLASERLRAASGELSPALIIGAGVATGAVAARLPAKTWSLPLAAVLMASRHAARLPIGRWLLLTLTRRRRRWSNRLRAMMRAPAAAAPGTPHL